MVKNILIAILIIAALGAGYLFLSGQSSSNQSGIVSSSGDTTLPAASGGVGMDTSAVPAAQNLLSVLLNVKTIKLDDSIFSTPAFKNLHDSSITLVPDASPGRPNPFAQFGNDATPTTSPAVSAAANGVPTSSNNVTTTPGASQNIPTAPSTTSASPSTAGSTGSTSTGQ